MSVVGIVPVAQTFLQQIKNFIEIVLRLRLFFVNI